MSDDSPWVLGIIEILNDSLGSPEQKGRCLTTARQLDRMLPKGPARGTDFAEGLRGSFVEWTKHMHYLVPEPRVDHELPLSVKRTDAEVSAEFGIISKAAIAAKQVQLAAWAEMRARRCADHIDAGWSDGEVLCFVRSKEEWARAQQLARRPVH